MHTIFSLVPDAMAQEDAVPAQATLAETFLPLILIFVIFYLLVIRPQQKKVKQHKDMVESVRRGDKVITGGGIVGSVIKVDEDGHVDVEIADGVKIKVVASTLHHVASRSEPVKEDKKPATSSKKKKKS